MISNILAIYLIIMNQIINIKNQEKLLKTDLKTNVENVFNDSFKNILDLDDAISFAYGWLMLAYSMEFNIIDSKLSDLKQHYANNKTEKNLGFIINPVINISKMLKANEDILDLYNISKDEDLQIFDKLNEKFNFFLIELYKKKKLFDQFTPNEQKSVIYKLISSIDNKDILDNLQ